MTLPTPARIKVEGRSRDFPVEWSRETFSSPDKPDIDRRVHNRVITASDRQDAAAPANLN